MSDLSTLSSKWNYWKIILGMQRGQPLTRLGWEKGQFRQSNSFQKQLYTCWNPFFWLLKMAQTPSGKSPEKARIQGGQLLRVPFMPCFGHILQPAICQYNLMQHDAHCYQFLPPTCQWWLDIATLRLEVSKQCGRNQIIASALKTLTF